MRFERYVALGDSQSEGLLDPDGFGGFRGWADRFAESVAAEHPRLWYANLAVRGRLASQVHEEQLAPALALRPDLATVMAGFNDLLRPSFDLDTVAGHLDSMIGTLSRAGATVLTNTFPDPSGISPLFSWMAQRVQGLNDLIRAIGKQYGALVVDFAARDVGTDPRIWSPDRIHANPFGHSLIAAAFADTLGVAGNGHWTMPLPYRPTPSRPRRVAADAGWLVRIAVPWLMRRLMGKSSGDGITAKRPRLLPVANLFHLAQPPGPSVLSLDSPDALDSKPPAALLFGDQVADIANRNYPDADELVAIEVDTSRLDRGVRLNVARHGDVVDVHVDGRVPTTATVGVRALSRAMDGAWTFTARSW